MKAYVILGTTGAFIFTIKEDLAEVVNKPIKLKTSDSPSFSSTTFEFEVESPQEAKTKLDKVLKWLTEQPWYFDDDKVAFSTMGLVDDGSDWNCNECGEDIDSCECITEKEKVNG